MENTTNTTTENALQFQFTGDGGEYFKIWIVNLCLTVATLGIYSAWAKVRRNRYFYGNTKLAGSGFEYLANPLAILKGRAIALLFFGAISVSQHISFILYGVAIAVFLAALPWLIVRSMTFRARNTAYRNIRFNFTGKYGEAFLSFIVFPIILGIASLGLVYPYALYKQKKLLVDNSYYGNSAFSFYGASGMFYKIFGVIFLFSFGFMAAAVFIVMGLTVAHAGEGSTASPLLPLVVIYTLMLIFYTIVFAYFNARATNAVYNNTRLGEHRLHADLRATGLLALYAQNLLAIIFTLGLYIPWAKVRAAQYWAAHIRLIPVGNLDGFVAEQQSAMSSVGEEISGMFDVDIGI
ncbi:MAG: YjgN family protein [Pseudomonadota bacterium]